MNIAKGEAPPGGIGAAGLRRGCRRAVVDNNDPDPIAAKLSEALPLDPVEQRAQPGNSLESANADCNLAHPLAFSLTEGEAKNFSRLPIASPLKRASSGTMAGRRTASANTLGQRPAFAFSIARARARDRSRART